MRFIPYPNKFYDTVNLFFVQNNETLDFLLLVNDI